MLLYIWLALQIVLESFPVSSSGHMALFERILERFGYSFDKSLVACDVVVGDFLEHFVHGATIVVLAVFFFPRWFFLLKNFKRCYKIIFKIIGLAFVADCVTAAYYLLFHYVEKPSTTLGVGFVMTALLLLILHCLPTQNKLKKFDIRSALILGTFQGVALIPGISRFASTFVGARALGFRIHKALELSFLIQFPLIFAAFLNSMRVMIVCPEARAVLNGNVFAVMAIAGVVAYYAFAWVVRKAERNELWQFGVYMIVPIAALLLISL